MSILGLLTLASQAYLIAVKDRRQVAEIASSTVFTISSIHIIPLSYNEASKLIAKVYVDSHETIVGNNTYTVNPNDDTIERDVSSGGVSDEDEADISASPNVRRTLGKAVGMPAQISVYAKDWALGQRSPIGMRNQAQTSDDRSASQEDDLVGRDKTHSTTQVKGRDPMSERRIRDKLLQAIQALMTQGFYFSYDIDISKRLGSQELKGPLHESFDPLVSFCPKTVKVLRFSHSSSIIAIS